MKIGLHVKDESCSFKIKWDISIYVHQGEAKSQNRKTLKSWNLVRSLKFFSNSYMWSQIIPINKLSRAMRGHIWLLYLYLGGPLRTPAMGATESDVWIFVMKSRDTCGGRSPDSWLIHDHQFFLKGKVLTYSPQLPYWDIRVSQTTFTQLGQLWRNKQIMPAPRRSPVQVLTQPSVA